MKTLLYTLALSCVLTATARAQIALDPDDHASLGTFAPTADVGVTTNPPSLTVTGDPPIVGVIANNRAVFTFDSVEIPAGVTITATGEFPFTLLSKSKIVLGGTIDVSGQDGQGGGLTPGGPGGWSSEQGPGQGNNGSGGGHGGRGGDSSGSNGGNNYGASSFQGGSGGGNGSSAGGGGGGAVELGAKCCVEMQAGSSILANGGMPGNGSFGSTSGGAGAGGGIYLHAPDLTLLGTLRARGGSASQANGGGGGGGGGRIWLRSSTGFTPSGSVQLNGGGGGGNVFPFGSGDPGDPGQLHQLTLSFDDCNQNGMEDACDIQNGISTDVDGNGVPDECGNGASFCFGDGGDQMGCSDCPCGNNAAPGTPGGCINESGQSAQLLVSGVPSVAMDTLRFEMSGGNPLTFAVLTSGAARAPSNPTNPCFGQDSGINAIQLNGLRCVVQNVLRHGARPTDLTGTVGMTTNGWGPPSGPAGGLILQGGFSSGQVRHYQVIYRETPFATCTQSQNTTQGVSILFVP